MKKFVFKLFYFLLPVFVLFIVLTFLYVKRDVYRDFSLEKEYFWKYSFQQLGDLNTKKLLSTPLPYNSFIMGSSRSCSVYGCYLQTKIPGSQFFQYANWQERIGGILAKLELIDSLGYDIKNVIIYLDNDYTFAGNGKIRSSDHYLLSKQNKYKYYLNHFRSYFSSISIEKVNILLGLEVEGDIFPNSQSDERTNDFNHHCSDSVILNYGEVVDDIRHKKKIDSLRTVGFLYQRSPVQRAPAKQISNTEVTMISRIKSLFDKHGTQYYIIITPLYDQLKFNSSDIAILKRYFGLNLYDFSGINSITNNQYNYPDRLHFQKYVSKEILDSILFTRKPQ